MKLYKLSIVPFSIASACILFASVASTEQMAKGVKPDTTSHESPSGNEANPPSTGSRLSAAEVQTLLDLHNKVRSDVNVGPLSWSDELASYAQKWADHLASTGCQMEHRPRSGEWKQLYGENLFIGTSGHYSVADALTSWENEKNYYSGGPIDRSNYMNIGHYTQVIWQNTMRLGCASALCNGDMIVVCNYDPPGNFLGQKPY